ncbi:ABC transporter permease [Plantactinospora sp. GCM10030261]|uniref:ABC transporter permease n=1 Tax=Plantactinospora sp. GCM10030261 TaxID=3273420 RepID=UPI003615141C
MKLIRAELLKIRSTSTWWIFALIALPLWGITLLFNWVQTNFLLNPPENLPPDQSGEFAAAQDLQNIAANLYTNGQLLGLLVVTLLGVIVVTNEFFHQTATTTFLTTPHRTAVIVAKLVAASLLGVLFWLITSALNLVVTPLILADVGAQLGEAFVWRAIGLNGLAYLLFAIFGVGFGILIRSQIGATVTVMLLYLGGYIGALIFLGVFANRFGDWINNLAVIVPSLASQLMVAGTELPGNPPRWVGAVVLVGYAAVAGTIGTLLTRRRDIS